MKRGRMIAIILNVITDIMKELLGWSHSIKKERGYCMQVNSVELQISLVTMLDWL